MDIQTEAYLEELADTVPEAEVMTQTDAFMDRPTPLFIPMKIGVDVETQIESGDLFDFDFEVEPILEVLVGKTLEQGLMEVMEEEELAAMPRTRSTSSRFATLSSWRRNAWKRRSGARRRKGNAASRRSGNASRGRRRCARKLPRKRSPAATCLV